MARQCVNHMNRVPPAGSAWSAQFAGRRKPTTCGLTHPTHQPVTRFACANSRSAGVSRETSRTTSTNGSTTAFGCLIRRQSSVHLPSSMQSRWKVQNSSTMRRTSKSTTGRRGVPLSLKPHSSQQLSSLARSLWKDAMSPASRCTRRRSARHCLATLLRR